VLAEVARIVAIFFENRGRISEFSRIFRSEKRLRSL
jgi:hypothetical protein